MGMMASYVQGAVRLPCVGGLVRLTGPEPLIGTLARLLSGLTMPAEASSVLDVTVSPDASLAHGVVDARLVWSISLPPGTPVASLLGQIVGTLTGSLSRLLFVHAGVVALEGRGMVLVGQGGAGKTSTVAALLRRGATYLSDEVALLDPQARTVAPFNLPMTIKPWTRKAAGQLPPGHPVGREGGVEFWLPRTHEPRPVGVETVVLLRDQGSGAGLAPISRPKMLLALAEQASTFKQRDRVTEAFAGFSQLLRGARCLVLDARRPAGYADRLAVLGAAPA